jgi:hypothetical protein
VWASKTQLYDNLTLAVASAGSRTRLKNVLTRQVDRGQYPIIFRMSLVPANQRIYPCRRIMQVQASPHHRPLCSPSSDSGAGNLMRESIQQPELVKEGRILAATAAPTLLHSQTFAVQSFFRPYTQHTRNAECLCSYGQWRIPQHIPTGNCYHFTGETSVVKRILVHTRIHDIPTMCGASPKSTSSFMHIDNLM